MIILFQILPVETERGVSLLAIFNNTYIAQRCQEMAVVVAAEGR
jgi:hypothetical protein